MISKKICLAIVPARGGSKGIKNKNIFLINKTPLISYTIELLNDLPWLDYKLVSTDSNEIMKISKELGIEETKLRPSELSGDNVGDLPVLRHELLQFESTKGVLVDFIIMLQPTSPIRYKDFITEAAIKLINSGANSLLSIKSVDLKFHPHKQFSISGNELNFFHPLGSNIFQRQQLKPTYIRDGVFYGFTRDFILDHNSVIGEKSSYILNPNLSINIDTSTDIEEFSKYIASKPRF